MIRRYCYLASVFVFGLALLRAWGAPLPPMKPVTVEGTIERVQWSPDTKIPGRPGLSGSLGVDRVEPAHFRITLVDYRGVDTATAWRLNRLVGELGASTADEREPPHSLVLKLNDDEPRALIPGMRIRVRGYVVSGDEGGTWTRYQSRDILSRPAEAKPQAK